MPSLTRTIARSARPLPTLALGLLLASLVLDLVDVATGTGAFHVAAYWTLGAGMLCGVVAAAWQVAARRTGGWRHLQPLVMWSAFAASWLLRTPEGDLSAWALGLSLGGAALSLRWRAGARRDADEAPVRAL